MEAVMSYSYHSPGNKDRMAENRRIPWTSSQEKPRRKAGHPTAKMEALSGREGEREAVTGTPHMKPQLV